MQCTNGGAICRGIAHDILRAFRHLFGELQLAKWIGSRHLFTGRAGLAQGSHD